MQREIKFRAKDKESGRWHYFVIEPTEENMEETISFGSPIHVELFKEGVLEHWGEYTGLKDKHGKEIYEGDVVKYRHSLDHRRKWTTTIEWDDAQFTSRVGRLNELHEPEVIGNIYENPELLEDNE